MAHTITLKNGKTETLFDLADFMRLLEEHIGPGAAGWLEDYLADQNEVDLEEEIDSLHAHHTEVMEALREQSEIIARLIQEKNIDRKALSAAAGRIGTITQKERR